MGVSWGLGACSTSRGLPALTARPHTDLLFADRTKQDDYWPLRQPFEAAVVLLLLSAWGCRAAWDAVGFCPGGLGPGCTALQNLGFWIWLQNGTRFTEQVTWQLAGCCVLFWLQVASCNAVDDMKMQG